MEQCGESVFREKDLLKSVKDQDLARNLPGKVGQQSQHLASHT
jgi:hypothetical protein